jgi:signal peptidase II
MSGAPDAAPSIAVAWARWFIPSALAVLVLDQLSKWWVFARDERSFPSWIVHAHNTGVAWSVGQGMPLVVAIATLVLIPILAWVWWSRFRALGAAENLAFGLILGGAVGNAIDRACALAGAFRITGVRDFINIDLGFPPFHPFATFNVADAGISVGFVILVALSFRKPRAHAPTRAAAVADH